MLPGGLTSLLRTTGSANVCPASHLIHRPHSRQGDQDLLDQNPPGCDRGQGAMVAMLPLPRNGRRAHHRPCAQIYVEIERARLTRKLATMLEQDGNVSDAAEILQEVAVVLSCNPHCARCTHRTATFCQAHSATSTPPRACHSPPPPTAWHSGTCIDH
jgi:hypothetical protein